MERYTRLAQRQVELQEETLRIDSELAGLSYFKYKAKEYNDNKLVDNFIDCLKRDGIYLSTCDFFNNLGNDALTKLRTFNQCGVKTCAFSMGISESGVTLEDMPLPSNDTQAKIFPLVIEKLTPHLPILPEVFLQSVQPSGPVRKYGVRLKTTLPIDFDLEGGASMVVWFVDDMHSFTEKLTKQDPTMG